MNPETDLICFEIVKGIPKAPGDTASAEQDLVTFDLLDVNGLSVQPNGWTMAQPGIKRGGTWAESQLTDGRTLIAAGKENVVETISLVMSNASLQQRHQILASLRRLADDARLFWTHNYQIEPVYLKLKVAGATAHQYALIYNIEVADSSDPFNIHVAWEVTITVEREPAWNLVVPPGGNPIEYLFWSQGKTRGVEYDYTDMSLWENTDHFAYKDVTMRCEFNAAYDALRSENFIDIDANDIPGDAPALLFVDVEEDLPPNWNPYELYIARSTLPRTVDDQEDATFLTRNTLNAGDADVGSLITKAISASCGVYSNGGANRYHGTYTVPAGVSANWREDVCRWRDGINGATTLNLNSFRGEYIVFVRMAATNGSDGDIQVRLKVTNLANTVWYSPVVDLPVDTLIITCVDYFLLYFGRITIPLGSKARSWVDGRGLSTILQSGGTGNLEFQLQTWNTTGSTRDIQILDLWLMPVGEETGSVFLDLDYVAPDFHIYADNTGYVNHGEPISIGRHINEVTDPGRRWHDDKEVRGSIPTLKPKHNNRLYFLLAENNANRDNLASRAPTELTTRLNIIPRCYGVSPL